MIYGNVFLPKQKETNMFVIESVVLDEYCNRIDLLEVCTDESTKPILEAQIQVLQEVTFKDIIGKIKAVWEKLKKWVIDLWNKIFHNKKTAEKEFEEEMKELKDEINKAFENFNSEEPEDDLKLAGILTDLHFPYWVFQDEDSTVRIKVGELSSGKDGSKILNFNKFTSSVYNFLDFWTDSLNKDIGTYYVLFDKNRKRDVYDEIEKTKEKIKKYIDNISSTHLKWIALYGPLKLGGKDSKYIRHVEFKDVTEESKENLLKVLDEYNNLVYKDFKTDSEECISAKKQIDSYISRLDNSIKKSENKMNEFQQKIKDIGKARSEYVKRHITTGYKMSEAEFEEFYHYKYWDNERRKHVNISDEEAEKNTIRYEMSNAYNPDYKYETYIKEIDKSNKEWAKKELEKLPNDEHGNLLFISKDDIKRNEKYRDLYKNMIKEYNDAISCVKKATDAISGVELKITKGIERCTSEIEKVKKTLKEKYNSDAEGNDDSNIIDID